MPNKIKKKNRWLTIYYPIHPNSLVQHFNQCGNSILICSSKSCDYKSAIHEKKMSKKSFIRKTQNLSMCADSSTSTEKSFKKQLSQVRCQVSHVTCHMSLRLRARARDPPPAPRTAVQLVYNPFSQFVSQALLYHQLHVPDIGSNIWIFFLLVFSDL